MNQNQYPIDGAQRRTIVYDDSLQRTLIQRVFLWMAIGLGITGLTSLLLFKNTGLLYGLMSSRPLFWGLIIAEFALVVFLSSRITKMSFTTATTLFGAYAVLNGITLTPIFLVYTASSIAETFFVTAGTFTAMAIFGYVTKRDLTKLGSLLMMALIGIVIASLVNLFLVKSDMMSLIISIIGVIIFVGLTAYDVQKFKVLFSQAYEDSDDMKKLAVLGALTLYLDFINLFLHLLRLLGRRD